MKYEDEIYNPMQIQSILQEYEASQIHVAMNSVKGQGS